MIKNVETGEILHVENQKGFVEHSHLQETAYSGQWKKETINGYSRFINRWKPDQVIHIENNLGYLEYGPIHQGAWSSQWSLE